MDFSIPVTRDILSEVSYLDHFRGSWNGNLAQVPALAYSGAECGLGTGGSTTFAPPAGNIFWIVAASDSNGVEGSHGFDSEQMQREAAAAGLCGFTVQVKGDTCP